MSAELEQMLANLSDDVAPQLIHAVKEAATCRENVYGGEVDADPHELHIHLVRNRSLIERLEHLTSMLVLMKSRTSKAVASRKDAYTDKYNQAATKKTASFGNDYTSAKEKDAAASLAAVEEQIALRKAELLHRDVESAWEFCRILLRGAEGAQHDIETRIRLITLTNALEK